MFQKLKQKWKVNGVQLTLILITFALGGSATGYAAKKIMNLFLLKQDWIWTLVYIFLIIIIWPAAVLVISIFFGQFRFFWRYVKRMFSKIGLSGKQNHLISNLQSSAFNIAIFASGTGSNAKNIIEYFNPDNYQGSSTIKIALIVCNKPGAGVLKIAEENNIPTLLIEKERFLKGDGYVTDLQKFKIDLIVLAGFLWKIPHSLISIYPKRIINIHPALLPKYGGKGMYGQKVHESVLMAKEKESGITVHFVDEHYDHGDIILQVKCAVLKDDTPETLAHRIHALEYANYPVVIEELINHMHSSSHPVL